MTSLGAHFKTKTNKKITEKKKADQFLPANLSNRISSIALDVVNSSPAAREGGLHRRHCE